MLILGAEPLNATARHDLLEIIEECYGGRSTIITSQIRVDKWRDLIDDPTYADMPSSIASSTMTNRISPATACDAPAPVKHHQRSDLAR
jgi:DNA replication protein DnaC